MPIQKQEMFAFGVKVVPYRWSQVVYQFPAIHLPPAKAITRRFSVQYLTPLWNQFHITKQRPPETTLPSVAEYTLFPSNRFLGFTDRFRGWD